MCHIYRILDRQQASVRPAALNGTTIQGEIKGPLANTVGNGRREERKNRGEVMRPLFLLQTPISDRALVDTLR